MTPMLLHKTESGGLFAEADDPSLRVQALIVDVAADDSRVTLTVRVNHSGRGEVARYLTPLEAMAFAKAFERCAIMALENSVD